MVERLGEKYGGKFRLTYLDIPGLGESIRTTLRVGKVEFEDVRVSYEVVASLREKGELPCGQVPLLEIGDGVKLSQSEAILRLAGKLGGTYPVNDYVLAARCDMVLSQLADVKVALRPLWYKHVLGRSPRSGKKLVPLSDEQNIQVLKYLNGEILPTHFQRLEAIFESRPEGKYFCGKNLMVCDIEFYFVVSGLLDGTYAGEVVSKGLLNECPNLQGLLETVRRALGAGATGQTG